MISCILILSNSNLMCIGFVAAIMHELGHFFAMKLKGHRIEKININFFNVDILDKDKNFSSLKDELFILSSGPLFNFIIAIIFLIIFYFTGVISLKYIAYINLTIGTFNFLPISSLDGGQILYNLLLQIFSERTTDIICLIVSFIFLFPMAIVGFLILLNSKYNFSLLFICFYLIFIILSKNNEMP